MWDWIRCFSENNKENDGKDACHDTDEGEPGAERAGWTHVLAVHQHRQGKHGNCPRVAALEVEAVECVAHKIVAVVSVFQRRESNEHCGSSRNGGRERNL